MTIAQRIEAALRQAPASSGELGELVDLSTSLACHYLCRMRQRGVVQVIATRPCSRGRAENIWALTEDRRDALSAEIRPSYTQRPCLGVVCQGQRTFRSSGPGHRICPRCSALIAPGDAEYVAQEVEGWTA